MNPGVLVAGTGRMGRILGLHCLSRGYDVCWLSRDAIRQAEFAARVARDVRRLARGFPGGDAAGRTAVALYDDPWPFPPTVLLEAVVERREAKAAVLARVVPRLPEGALILSSTSSFLPAEVHPAAVVTHFFSPPELAGFVEVVWPSEGSVQRGPVRAFVRSLGLEALEQSPHSAFAATRLLLPLQNEYFRALESGVSRSDLEEVSSSSLFPTGQAAFLDRVGSETVLFSVQNYLSRMPAAEAAEYAVLERGLRGWRAGAAVADGERKLSPQEKEALRQRLLCALLNACYRLADSGQLDGRGLDLILNGFFWAQAPLPEILAQEGASRVLECLGESYRATGLSYFVPTPTLGAAST